MLFLLDHFITCLLCVVLVQVFFMTLDCNRLFMNANIWNQLLHVDMIQSNVTLIRPGHIIMTCIVNVTHNRTPT